MQNEIQTQVDRALRDAESKTLKIQQEIGDLHDQIRELTQQFTVMKSNVQGMLTDEFEKVNKNFVNYGRQLDSKEQRLQAEIDKLKAELDAQEEAGPTRLNVGIRGGGGANADEVEQLKKTVAQHQEVLQRANQEIVNLRNSIQAVLELEP